MDQWPIGWAMTGRFILPVVAIAFFGIVSSVRADQVGAPRSYHSPEDIGLIKKSPSIRVARRPDHVEIEYPPLSLNGKIYKVVENRWEDGSEYSVSNSTNVVFKLRDASPYWGYGLGGDLKIYFVDGDLP